MKRLFLLIAAALFTLHVSAQNPGARSTKIGPRIGGSRWYSHFLDIDLLISNGWTATPNTNIFSTPMWFDSTVLMRYSDTVLPVALTSVGEFVDPINYTEYNNINNPLLDHDSNAIQVTPDVSYVVDSVRIFAGYVAAPGKSSVVDTLIISIQPQAYINYYSPIEIAWINNNPFSMDTGIYVFVPFADSINKVGISDSIGLTGVVWKQPLYPLIDADTVLKFFTYQVPGGAKIPAGHPFTVAYTFKSGDTTTPGVDSIQQFNSFQPVWGYESSPPSWMTYWFGNKFGPTTGIADTAWHDDNGSSIMLANHTDLYMSTFALQKLLTASSDGNTPIQYLYVESKIKCDSCYSVGEVATAVKNVPKTIGKIETYPNPADNIVYIPFTLNQYANVTATLTDASGRMIRMQNMGNVISGKAVFYTSDLPSGIYVYNLKANDQVTTGRISIIH
ncbi:MAG TPA: T9SS type A sorting domain-containing protein [Flavipsychrobacter sp.]|nr:T9SS type A sorting domain-containing protein [Flavipsychrobacter sp.]